MYKWTLTFAFIFCIICQVATRDKDKLLTQDFGNSVPYGFRKNFVGVALTNYLSEK